jgi:AAA+ superfamily predicted ATPase
LDGLIGLSGVKKTVGTIFNQLAVEQRRKGRNARIAPGHFVFVGNPGTGKTTVARLMTEQFFALGLIERWEVHAKTASQLIRGYVGQTARAAQEFLDKGLGGLIFIDEAHQLNGGKDGGTDYGTDVIKLLMPFAEDNAHRCSIVLAGYPREMKVMLSADPGLENRFRNRIVFEDYSADEMMEIFRRFAAGDTYVLEGGIEVPLRKLFEAIEASRPPAYANARGVRNVFAQCRANLANRLAAKGDYADEEASLLTVADVPRRLVVSD